MIPKIWVWWHERKGHIVVMQVMSPLPGDIGSRGRWYRCSCGKDYAD